MNMLNIWKTMGKLAALGGLTASVALPASAAGKIVFGGNGEIYSMNSDGTEATNLTRTSTSENKPNVTPDGSKIVFDNGRGKGIGIMDGNGANRRSLLADRWSDYDFDAAISPDGLRIAFVSENEEYDTEIYGMNADGTNLKRLTYNFVASEFAPSFSDDGSQIFYCRDANNGTEIFVMNFDGSGQTNISNAAGRNINPDFRDGQIVFSSNRDGNNEIYVMEADGSNQKRLTTHSASDEQPAWSPDGSQIAFVSNRDGNNEIYVMNADGSNQKRINNNFSYVSSPSWFATPRTGAVAVRVSDAPTVTEGKSTKAVFTVTLSKPSAQTVRVNYRTSNGSAVAPGDYVAVPATKLTFLPGQTSKTVSVTVNDDTISEPDQIFRLLLSNAENAVLDDAIGAATITDDELPSTLTLGNASNSEGSALNGIRPLVFPLTLSSRSEHTFSASFTLTGFDAIAGSDYRNPTSTASATVTIPAGQTSGSLVVTMLSDTTQEAHETLLVTLSDPVGATLGNSTAVGTIVNDDFPVLSIVGSSASEGNKGGRPGDFAVSLSYASLYPVTFDYTTADGTATAGSDYVARRGSITIPAGQTSQIIRISVLGDADYEPSETFSLRLSRLKGAQVSSTLSRNSVNGHFYELMSGGGHSSYYLSWSDAKTLAAARSYLGVQGHLATITSQAENDFILSIPNYSASAWLGGARPAQTEEAPRNFGWITGEPFAYTNWGTGKPGNSMGEQAIVLSPYGVWQDNSISARDINYYLVEYDIAPDAPGSGGEATVGILNDDEPIPTLSINDASINEGDSGTQTMAFTVTMDVAISRSVTVKVATSTIEGTATPGTDYTPVAPFFLTFASGETSKTVNVSIKGDSIVEENELFYVRLGSATNATILDKSGTGKIRDDDSARTLSVNDVTVIEGEKAIFTVQLSGISGKMVTVKVATSPTGTATPGSDYTSVAPFFLSFAPGETMKTVSVPTKSDELNEGNELFFMHLGSATNATILDKAGTGRILNDDAVPTLSVNNVRVNEGQTAVFTIRLSAPSGKTVTVKAGTRDATATGGADYTKIPDTLLTFNPGQTTKTFSVPTTNDATTGENEYFWVRLTSPLKASLKDGFGTGTIVNGVPSAQDNSSPSLSPSASGS